MKIWFAGNTGVEKREATVCSMGCSRLFSYHFVASDFFNSRAMMNVAVKHKVDLFLDSGAFSAWTQGVEVKIDDYIQFIKDHEDVIDVYANLDVIGIGGKQPNKLTAEMTLKNQKIMEAAGLKPMAVFHFGEPFKYLEYYLKRNDYIALGVAGNSGKKIQPWLDECFSKYICDENGYPKRKIHGFAVTSLSNMIRYPWFSVDSTSWVVTGRTGFIYVPRFRNGKWLYDENSWKIAVSNQSPSMREIGKHITTMSPKNQEIALHYITDKGYKIGKSSFKTEDQTYKLADNERWAQKKPKDKSAKRRVEIIEEDGISNRYQLRDEMNIIYFLDLEKTIPPWPWPFKIDKKIKPNFSL